MKATNIDHKRCSCSDCLFNDGPTEDWLINKNDEFPYKEYLQPNEQKLVENLLKIRAAYDDARKEVLGGSSSLSRGRTIVKRKNNLHDGDHDNKDAIRAIVDLIDRGEILDKSLHLKPKNKLSDCCSCCTCNSKIHRHKQVKQRHLQNKIRALSSGRIHIKRKISDKYRKLKSLNFKTKKLRSDPCTCTLNLIDFLDSEPVINNSEKFDLITPKPSTITLKTLKAKSVICKCKITNFSKQSLEKIKNAKDKVRESVKRSISKLETSLRSVKDSIELYRERLKLKKFLKEYECEPNFCVPEECVPMDCYKKMKQNIHKFASGLSLKTNSKVTQKSVICDCKPTSKSASSMVNISRNSTEKLFKTNKKNLKKYEVSDDIGNTNKTGLRIKIEPNSNKQKSRKSKKINRTFKETAGESITNIKTDYSYPRECLPMMCVQDNCDYIECATLSSSNQRFPEKTDRSNSVDINDRTNKMNKHKKVNHLHTNKVQIQDITPNNDIPRSHNNVVRIGSTLSFNIEFSREKYRQHNIAKHKRKIDTNLHELRKRKPSFGLKKCFCTLKLTDNQNRGDMPLVNKKISGTAKKIGRQNNERIQCECKIHDNDCECEKHSKSTTTMNTSNRDLISSYKCDPCDFVSDKCDPAVCDKKIQSELQLMSTPVTQTNYLKNRRHKKNPTGYLTPITAKSLVLSQQTPRTKSIRRNSTSKNYINVNNEFGSNSIHENNLVRNIVRVGSNFSFNIEFFKEVAPGGDNIPSNKPPKIFKTNIIAKPYHHKKIIRNFAETDLKTNIDDNYYLRKCFCRSQKKKLIRQSKRKQLTKRSSAQTPTTNICECLVKAISTQTLKYKGNESASYLSNKVQVPYTISRAGDPAECINKGIKCYKTEKIGTYDKLNSASANTNRHESSFFKYQPLHQRNPNPKKAMKDKELYDLTTRQRVRIGSKCSFHIEFYKENVGNSSYGISTDLMERSVEVKTAATEKPKKSFNISQRIHNPYTGSAKGSFIRKCLCRLKISKQSKLVSPKINQLSKVHKNKTKARSCQCKNALDFFKTNSKPIQYTNKTSNTSTKKFKSMSSGTSKSYIESHLIKAQISEPSYKSNFVKTFEYGDVTIDKNLIRIGSNYNFCIELCKQLESPDVDDSKQLLNENYNNLYTNDDENESAVKRWFCTLKHHKIRHMGDMHKGEHDFSKNNKTKLPSIKNKEVAVQLKFDEPKDQLKIYKYYKESGTATSRVPMKHQINTTKIKPPNKKSEMVQSITRKSKRRKTLKKYFPFTPTKRLVRINSIFSFDLEFNKLQCLYNFV